MTSNTIAKTSGSTITAPIRPDHNESIRINLTTAIGPSKVVRRRLRSAAMCCHFQRVPVAKRNSLMGLMLFMKAA